MIKLVTVEVRFWAARRACASGESWACKLMVSLKKEDIFCVEKEITGQNTIWPAKRSIVFSGGTLDFMRKLEDFLKSGYFSVFRLFGVDKLTQEPGDFLRAWAL